MRKLLNSKKGFNDMTLISGIIIIFILIGFVTPFLAEDFNADLPEYKPNTVLSRVGDDICTVDSGSNCEPSPSATITIFKVIFSVVTMFFWNFGGLPTWMNVLFIPFRIMLAVTVARNIWPGGGA